MKEYINELRIIKEKQEKKFDNTPKIIILSPPRSASTILSLMLNIHPKFYIFCESTLNRVFLNVNNDFGRIVSYSTRTRRDVSKIVDYCTKGYMSYKDFYLMMSMSNKKIVENVENGWIIGDKNPMMIYEYISFIKWALSEPRFFFPCIIKDDLSLIIKSFYKEAIRRDIYIIMMKMSCAII